jgi:hypothetical protein
MMREWVIDRMADDIQLSSHVPRSRMYSSGAVGRGMEISPDRPFIVVRANGYTVAPVPGVKQQMYTIYVHDDQGSMLQHIDPVLLRVRALFEKGGGYHFDSIWITDSDWLGEGPDLYDDMFKTTVKYADVRAVWRGQ